MKSTDIPNGFIFLGKMGNNTLVDFDDNGKMLEESQMVSIAGWPDSICNNGIVKKGIIVLVHCVKGTEGMLVKMLTSVQMEMDGKPITVNEICKLGKLKETSEKIWVKYMESAKKKKK